MGPGTALRAGRALPAVTLNPCRRVNVNTFPLSDLVVHCRGVGFDLRDFASQPEALGLAGVALQRSGLHKY